MYAPRATPAPRTSPAAHHRQLLQVLANPEQTEQIDPVFARAACVPNDSRFTVAHLARELGVSHERCRHYIDKLAAADLISWQAMLGREPRYGLTPKGREVLAERGYI